MGPVERFSTSGLPVRSRVEFWNELATRTYTPLTADPKDARHFAAQLARTSVGELGMGLVRSSPSVMIHSDAHVARAGRRVFFLQFQCDGRSILRQAGREACLGPGDFTLVDNCQPFEMVFEGATTILVLGMPEKALRGHVCRPDDVVGVTMSYRENLNRLLCDFAQGLWRQSRAGRGPDVAPKLTRAIFELTASAYSVVPQAQTARAAPAEMHRARILSYVERNLSDPGLTPSTIAPAMRMTPRYLHLLFSAGGETLSRYILRRRLEECARVLACHSQPIPSISSVAFDYGFASLTHFGKVFREKYGVTPSDYRHQRRQPQPHGTRSGRRRVQ